MKISSERMRLYAVTPCAQDADALLRQVAEAIAGGAGVVQLRQKHMDDAALLALARRFVEVCRAGGAVSIINDRPDIAVASGADGAHVGQDDGDAARARAALGPDKILGVSAHSADEALRAQAAGADYLGAGAAFPTGTKADARPIGHESYREITRAVEIPVVAIGGVNRENARALSGLGLSGVAVVSAIFGAADVRTAAQEMRAIAEEIANT